MNKKEVDSKVGGIKPQSMSGQSIGSEAEQQVQKPKVKRGRAGERLFQIRHKLSSSFLAFFKRYRKLFLIFGILIFILVVLGIVAPFVFKRQRSVIEGESPSLVEEEIGEEEKIIDFGEDEELEAIYGKLKEIEGQYGDLEISESELKPPVLDYSVSF
jgi:hypothetical protein